MFFNILEAASEANKGNNFTGYIGIIVIVVLLIAFFVWTFISNKKKEKNFKETVDAIKPGSKVKTIGGIIGEVVSVNKEEGTFVLRTGDNDNASFMTFDRQAVYQTDAKPVPAEEKPAEEKVAQEQPKEEAPVAEAEVKEESKPEEK